MSRTPSKPSAGARFTPGPASRVEGAGPKRHGDSGYKPEHRWSAILLALAIAAVAVAFVWLFVVPRAGWFGGGAGSSPSGMQTSSITVDDGSTWDLSSDLDTPVELTGVSDDGVAIRFLSDPGYAFLTLHVVSCEVNGEAHDPTDATDPIRYTVVNESTGESVQTIDPYFITSGSGEGASGTVLIVKVEGLAADQYDSVVLGLDETIAEGDVASGDYTTDDVSGLAVSVTRQG